jgi:hypothetical protein
MNKEAYEISYFIIAFASYVESSDGFAETFASWMKVRNAVEFLSSS